MISYKDTPTRLYHGTPQTKRMGRGLVMMTTSCKKHKHQWGNLEKKRNPEMCWYRQNQHKELRSPQAQSSRILGLLRYWTWSTCQTPSSFPGCWFWIQPLHQILRPNHPQLWGLGLQVGWVALNQLTVFNLWSMNYCTEVLPICSEPRRSRYVCPDYLNKQVGALIRWHTLCHGWDSRAMCVDC